MKNICLTFIYIMSQSPCQWALTLLSAERLPGQTWQMLNNHETACLIIPRLTRYRNPFLSSSCSPSESPPHHGPTSLSSGRLRLFLFSSNISRWFSRFSDQQYRWVKSSASLTEGNYLPVGESSLPLTGSSLVFGLDHHHPSLCGTELQHQAVTVTLSSHLLPLTCIE